MRPFLQDVLLQLKEARDALARVAPDDLESTLGVMVERALDLMLEGDYRSLAHSILNTVRSRASTPLDKVAPHIRDSVQRLQLRYLLPRYASIADWMLEGNRREKWMRRSVAELMSSGRTLTNALALIRAVVRSDLALEALFLRDTALIAKICRMLWSSAEPSKFDRERALHRVCDDVLADRKQDAALRWLSHLRRDTELWRGRPSSGMLSFAIAQWLERDEESADDCMSVLARLRKALRGNWQ